MGAVGLGRGWACIWGQLNYFTTTQTQPKRAQMGFGGRSKAGDYATTTKSKKSPSVPMRGFGGLSMHWEPIKPVYQY